MQFDDVDACLITALQKDARASISQLASDLGVSRATLRSRLERLERDGVILGYTVRMKGEAKEDPVRAVTMIKLVGAKADAVINRLRRIAAMRQIYTTNGKWDLIAYLGADTLEGLDAALTAMREIPNIAESETSLLLAEKG